MAQEAKDRWFLIVEDNDDETQMARRAFSKADVCGELVVARDGEEAIGLLEAAASCPSFVLLDIKLPKVSGLDVLKWMRSHKKCGSIPAVVLVGAIGANELASIYAMGANSLVRKELEYEPYMERMVPTLRYWLTVNAPA